MAYESILSGVWSGVSKSSSNDPTIWSDTVIEFYWTPDATKGAIRGAGMSFWRRMQIKFDLAGAFDWSTKKITLRKQHKGQYNNTVEYTGLIKVEKVEGNVDAVVIEGKYCNGHISLKRLRPVSQKSQRLFLTHSECTEIGILNDTRPETCAQLAGVVLARSRGLFENMATSLQSKQGAAHDECRAAASSASDTTPVEISDRASPLSAYSTNSSALARVVLAGPPPELARDGGIGAMSSEEVVRHLSGRYDGLSVSEKNDPTTWADTHLVFSLSGPDSGGEGRVAGQGTSCWRGMEIMFDVKGTFSLGQRTIRIQKKHKGRYKNVVIYHGVFWKDPADGRFVLSGTYTNGTFGLKQREDSSMPSRSGRVADQSTSTPNGRERRRVRARSEVGIDDCATDGSDATRRRMFSPGHLRGQRVDEVMPSPGTMRAVGEDGSSASSTSCTMDVEQSRTRSPETTQVLAETRKKFPGDVWDKGADGLTPGQVGEIEEMMSGIWGGESVDREHNITSWSDTAISFKVTNPASGDCALTGEGVSIWREMRIDFDVVGSFKWDTQRLTLQKQHKGRFNNRIVYKAELLTPHTFGEQDTGLHSSQSMDGIGCTISGTYNKGTIKLVKKRGLAASVDHIMAGISGASSENVQPDATFSGKLSDEGKINSSCRTNSSRLNSYKIFLSGIVCGGVIDKRGDEALAKFRAKHNVTEEEHVITLQSIGLSKSQFNMMRSIVNNSVVGCTGGGNDASNEEEMCKICFGERIDALILPCGHFAVCSACGEKLTLCPICRQPITKIQAIYRT